MISEYKPYIQKSDQLLFKIGLEKAKKSVFNLDFDSTTKSKIFRFACWVRNLDNEYKTHWLQTTAKIGLAALAVFGMLMLSPLIVGIVLLDKFITANRNITEIVKSERNIQNNELSHLNERKIFIDKLGGIETLNRIPVVEGKEINFIGKTKESSSSIFNFYMFENKDKEEIQKVFEEHQTPIFQSDSSLLSVWVQNKINQEREVLIMCSSSQNWTFANLSNTLFTTNTKDFGSRFVKNIESIETLGKMVNGTHNEYELVKF